MTDINWLSAQVREASKAFATQLRSCTDGSVPVPGLEWTVGGLGAHLASLPQVYRDQHELGDDFETPKDWAVFSIDARAHVTERNPDALAELLETEMDDFVTELSAEPNAGRMAYGQETKNHYVLGGFLGELIMHGQDLGQLTGTKVTMDRDQANAIVSNMMALTPAFARREEALKYPGTAHFKFRGGDDWTWTIADGKVTSSLGKPAKADAHMNADPVAFVMTSMGRRNQYLPALTGAMIVWGRKPLYFLKLASLKVDGV